MTGTNISTLTTLKMDLSDNPFVKYDIFEVTVNFPSRGTTIGIVYKYCEHQNIYYVSQSKNNSPRNQYSPVINRTNVWILIIEIKEPNM